ncbi:hypothetical protein P245_14140 [Comamonas thiooxydans]|uniref:Uncharacterized protein n=1 Tax=Comamonas thiooxydans TaxID=363952 RepID=A0A0E3BJU4_9BURK|nr:hypothetical protein P245_14140 [Comamonas thiooxydans]
MEPDIRHKERMSDAAVIGRLSSLIGRMRTSRVTSSIRQRIHT